MLIEEADSIFGTKKAAEQHEDLRALVNVGHQRNRPALRCVDPQQTPTEFETLAMVVLAGISRGHAGLNPPAHVGLGYGVGRDERSSSP